VFKKMLLDALEKAPPKSVDDLAIFFERSRERLEASLDKEQVSGEERARYLAQFQEGLNEAQVQFINAALETHGGGFDRLAATPDGPLDGLKNAFKQPLVWAIVLAALVVGLMLGVLLAG
jgi:multisubunit Na+/H+ antiporter MnhC subunit